MKKLLLTLAVTAMGLSAYAGQVTDVITWETLGSKATASSYAQTSVTQTNSGAEYLVNCGYNADSKCFIINANGGFVLSTKSPGTIASVSITNATGNSAKLKVYGQNTPFNQPSGNSWTNAQVAEMLGTALATNVNPYNFEDPYTYFAIQGSASCQITKLEIVWNVDDHLSAANLSFSKEKVEVEGLNGEFVAPILTKDTDGEITYSSSNEVVATVNETTGAVTIVGYGSAKITAVSAATSTFSAGSASYTINVSPGTINVAEALELLEKYSPFDAIVEGYITKITSTSVGSKGGLTYYISDNTDATNELQVYYGLGLDGEPFTSVDQIKVGAWVKVQGELLLYSNKTPEINSDSVILEYIENPTIEPDVNEITLGESFTASPNATNWAYESTVDTNAYLEVISETDYRESGELKIDTSGWDVLQDWEVYSEEGKTIYAGSLTSDVTYEVIYTGSEEVTMTLISGTYVPEGGTKYIENWATPYEVTISTDDIDVEISWGVEVTLADDTKELTVLLDGEEIGSIGVQYLQLISSDSNEPGLMTRADVGDSGTSLVILTSASGLFDEVGRYLVNIPEGLVITEDGAVNMEQDLVIEVSALAQGEISPENGEFKIGDEVILTVTYDDTIVKNEEAETVVYVYGGNGEEPFEASLTWDSSELSVNGKVLTINLGDKLEEGYYEVAIYNNVLTVNDTENAMQYIYFQVSYSDAINGINAADNKAEYYNLQGVKVNNPSKGIFIVNGKKVVIK